MSSNDRVSDSFDGGDDFLANKKHDDWFGKKTIGMFAGMALLVNNITGPGVPSLPNMFAESGWVFPTVTFILVWAFSSLSTTMYCEAMRKIHNNDHFRDRVEYTSIVQYYFGRIGYIFSQIGLNGALQSLNIISVIQSAQVMDNAISAIFHHTCALNISPFENPGDNVTVLESVRFWSCQDTNDVSGGNPWGCHVVLSMGYLVALVIALPMGYFNLDDNMVIQVGAFVLTLVCWGLWIVACFLSPTFASGDWAVPAIASGHSWTSQAGVIGTILFNFGFVTTVPSWVNEKKPDVSVNKTVWLSTLICNVVFFIVGIPGAMAFQKYLAGPATGKCAYDPTGTECGQSIMDILTGPFRPEVIANNHALDWVMQFSVYLFPIVAVLSSIPVFSIVIKYNCLENGWSHKSSFVWGVLFPWVVALPLLYQPNALNQFITFSSLIFVSFTDFIVPWVIYIILMLREEKHGNTLPSTEVPPINEYNAETTEKSRLLDVPFKISEHFAFPESWQLSYRFRIYAAAMLVVVMTAASLAGTVLSIQTSVATGWNCTAVGN